MKQYTAFIFARGGSKGVKDKNIRIVGGIPLIGHSIKTALESKYIKSVVVSTDSERIASVSREFGAEVLMRPEELAGDKSPEILSWRHAIDSRRDTLKEVFISLPATSPMRNTEDINKAIEKFEKGGFEVIFGISPSPRNPYLNMVKVDENDCIEVLIGGSNAVRRQDVPDVYDVTTCVYVGSVDYLEKCEKLMSGRVGYVEIPASRAIDIDTEYDLWIADLLLNNPFKINEEENGK